MDKRHLRRIAIIEKLFGLGFDGVTLPAGSADDETLREIVAHLKEIDANITKHAPRYPIRNIARIDLAVLRLSIFELLFKRAEPEKVIIDEAVRLAKEYGSDRSYSFINGVLGSILKKNNDGH